MSDDICGEIKGDGETCTFTPKYDDGKCGHHTDETPDGDNKKSLLERNESIMDLIAGEVQNGATIGEACSEADIGRGTHDGWMAKGKEPDSKEAFTKYRREVTRARRTAAKNERRQLKTMCAEQGDTRTFWKIHQEQYGDLYAGDVEETEQPEPIFAVPKELADEWQQQATPSQ